MTKLYDYGDGPGKKIEQVSRPERESAPSIWMLAGTCIAIAVAVFFFCLAIISAYLKYYP